MKLVSVSVTLLSAQNSETVRTIGVLKELMVHWVRQTDGHPDGYKTIWQRSDIEKYKSHHRETLRGRPGHRGACLEEVLPSQMHGLHYFLSN